MKTKHHTRRIFLIAVSLLMISRITNAQTFNCFISNDHLVSTTVFEFDISIQNTSGTDFLFRTFSLCITFNAGFAPIGSTITPSYVALSTELVNYVPGSILWSSTAPGFQVASNSNVFCSNGTIIPASGTPVRIATYRLTSNLPFNCTASNPNLVITGDASPSGLALKTTVTKWNDNTCVTTGNTTITGAATQYTRFSSQTQYGQVNNNRPIINSQPVSYTTCSGPDGNALFSVTATGNGTSIPVDFQWYENGIPITNGVGANATYNGTNSSTLQLSNISANMEGFQYTCNVLQCLPALSKTSSVATLHVNNTNDGNACTTDACNSITGVVTHSTVNPDDGNICTTDGCNSLTGVFHTPVNTDDGIANTIDGCSPLYGVFHLTNASAAIPYQAVARDNSGNVIANQLISLRFTLRDTLPAGTAVYQETCSATTNSLGLFTVNLGQGTPGNGTFPSVNWENGLKFLQVEMDAGGGTSYIDMGTQQMLSVPYAISAGAAANVIKATSATASLSISGNTTSTQTYDVPNATTTSSVFVSPSTALNAGLVIAYARVSVANTVEVSYRNTTSGVVSLQPGITLFITVIK
jgi:hypothetical protein